MPEVNRHYPALAAAAARVATAGSPAVSFTVTHFGSGAGSTAIAPPGEEHGIATETLSFYLADLGFRLHTWPSRLPTLPPGGATVRRVRTPEDNTRIYSGTVAINLDFLYDTARGSEILLTISHDRWRADYRDTLMLARAYQAMTAATHAAGVPVLFLQSPVSSFRDAPRRYRHDGSGEAPRTANALAVRMLAGFEDPDKRHHVIGEIAELAAELGMGLQLSDRRFGKVRGEWWTVLSMDAERYEQRKRELFSWAADGVPDTVRLLTFVGPARVGSTAAIVSDLAARNVGILAVSEASLQQLAFINLVVPMAPARRHRSSSSEDGVCPVDVGLGLVARDCGLTPRQQVHDQHRRPGDEEAAGYQVLVTGPIPLAEDVEPVHRPLWLSWEVPTEAGDVPEATMRLLGSDDRVVSVRLDYLRVRALPGGRQRGRAKIAVALAEHLDKPEDRTQVPPALSLLCPWAQREVAARLVATHVPSRAISIQLAWRERWIGRTSAVV
ncbi:hypothetical protein [Labedaea rhizosphaerae]|uniref:Uncharacterized protein n=1 Tax=Labedaea rhizosphaerae TaxID=598644 RepID=A0A4R6RYC1_LABRH|nr:hypothetical protein [Labedaea rhizosphaerae]TDP92132.1 hypothetical protein EV186_108345 [Labedaea rhizosphaerae]